MKRTWWRRLAQRFAYPRHWPVVCSYWQPEANEVIPPRIGVSIDGKVHWYRAEKQ